MGTVEKTVALVLFAAACLTSLVAYIGYGNVCLHYDGAESVAAVTSAQAR
jgi:hypothetical protein